MTMHAQFISRQAFLQGLQTLGRQRLESRRGSIIRGRYR